MLAHIRLHSLVILILGLNSAHSNTVQISLSGLRYSSATLLLILLQNTNLFQRLDDFAVYAARCINVM